MLDRRDRRRGGTAGAMDDFLLEREREKAAVAAERERAAGLWRRFQAAGGLSAWKEVLADPELQSWALCERLCHESAAVAEDDPRLAGSLAELAVEIASRLPGERDRRPQTLEYAWTHVGHVCRITGDLEGAERAFESARQCFLGSVGLLLNPFERGRVDGLQSLLLRDRGRFREALEKLDFGLRFLDRDAADRPAFLLEKGRLHRRLGQTETAVKALAEAAATVPESDPRLVLRIRLELGSALCDLGRQEEARVLPALPRSAAASARERFLLACLEGRIAAGCGRREEAEAALRESRRGFAEGSAGEGDVDDLALLCLELAALYSRQDRSAELRELTGTVSEVSASPALSREGAATLKLFGRLAGQGKLTAERAAQFALDFSRSRSRS